MHQHMLIPLHSLCYTRTCLSPKGQFWGSTNTFREEGQQNTCPHLNIRHCSLIWYFPLDTYLVDLHTKRTSTPSGWPLVGRNMYECNRVNKLALTYISALVGLLRKIIKYLVYSYFLLCFKSKRLHICKWLTQNAGPSNITLNKIYLKFTSVSRYPGENIEFLETADQIWKSAAPFEVATRKRRDSIVSESLPILPFDIFHCGKCYLA